MQLLSDQELEQIRVEVKTITRVAMDKAREETYEIVVDDDRKIYKKYLDGRKEYVGMSLIK